VNGSTIDVFLPESPGDPPRAQGLRDQFGSTKLGAIVAPNHDGEYLLRVSFVDIQEGWLPARTLGIARAGHDAAHCRGLADVLFGL
jgi:hypothetical protein